MEDFDFLSVFERCLSFEGDIVVELGCSIDIFEAGDVSALKI